MQFCLWDYVMSKLSLHWSVLHYQYQVPLIDILGVVWKCLLIEISAEFKATILVQCSCLR